MDCRTLATRNIGVRQAALGSWRMIFCSEPVATYSAGFSISESWISRRFPIDVTFAIALGGLKAR